MATITQLEYLLAVNRERHFGRAAKLCHVSQPSLSTQLQKLEDELSVVIFDRSKKPIVATEVGAEIIKQAQLIIKEHKKLHHLADISQIEPTGDFSLAVIPTLAPYLIPLFVGEFSKKFPKVQLKINEYKTEDIVRLLEEDEIDAGLLVTPLGNDSLIERHLFFEPFYPYISQQNALSKKKFIGENDLSVDELWLLAEGHCFRNQVLKVCSLDKKGTALPNVEFVSGNLETLKNLVKKSSGYTLLPELAVDELGPKDTEEHLRRFKKPVPTREVSLVYSRSFLKERVIEALEETILTTLPKRVRSLKKADVEVIDIM